MRGPIAIGEDFKRVAHQITEFFVFLSGHYLLDRRQALLTLNLERSYAEKHGHQAEKNEKWDSRCQNLSPDRHVTSTTAANNPVQLPAAVAGSNLQRGL
jgi:hypothetical protein